VKIDRDAIAHLEKLARLRISPDQADRIAEQLDRIIGFVEKLQSVDTSDVPPTRLISHGNEDHLREDEERPGLDRDTVLGQAPDHTAEYFRVPRVIDRGDS